MHEQRLLPEKPESAAFDRTPVNQAIWNVGFAYTLDAGERSESFPQRSKVIPPGGAIRAGNLFQVFPRSIEFRVIHGAVSKVFCAVIEFA